MRGFFCKNFITNSYKYNINTFIINLKKKRKFYEIF